MSHAVFERPFMLMAELVGVRKLEVNPDPHVKKRSSNDDVDATANMS